MADTDFQKAGKRIPKVHEQGIKSLGHQYTLLLTERHEGREVHDELLEGLKK